MLRVLLLMTVFALPFYSMVKTAWANPTQPVIQPKDLFLEINVSSKTIFVQSQVIYTVQFFRSVEITGASLTEPQTSADDAVIEKLGDDKNLETKRNGKRYLVVERRYAMFPQRSGTLTILPVRLDARVGQRDSPLNNFFKDPLEKGETLVKRHSATVKLTVKPIPPSFQSLPWLPAHQLQLTEEWSKNPPRLHVGETVIRTVTLHANGLTSAQLPEVLFGTKQAGEKQTKNKIPSTLKRYPDPPVLTDQRQPNGIVGIRRERWAIISSHPGRITLPTIKIPWWNRDTQSEDVVYLPGRTIEISASAHTDLTTTASQMAADDNGLSVFSREGKQPIAREKINEACKNILSCVSNTWKIIWGKLMSTGIHWPVLTIFFAFGWFVTILLWWFRHRLPLPHHSHHRSQLLGWLPFFGTRAQGDTNRKRNGLTDPDKLVKSVQQACRQNDPEKCRSVLLMWAQARWPEKPLNNLNDFHSLLTEQHNEACSQFFSISQQKAHEQRADEQHSETSNHIMTQHLGIAKLSQEITRLNQSLFSPIAGPWTGKALWESIQTLNAPPQQTRKQTPMLPPLYSQHTSH